MHDNTALQPRAGSDPVACDQDPNARLARQLLDYVSDDLLRSLTFMAGEESLPAEARIEALRALENHVGETIANLTCNGQLAMQLRHNADSEDEHARLSRLLSFRKPSRKTRSKA